LRRGVVSGFSGFCARLGDILSNLFERYKGTGFYWPEMPETHGVSASQSGTGIRVMHGVFPPQRIFRYIRRSDFFMNSKKTQKTCRDPGKWRVS
jgi:hypothetical protein